MNTGTVDNENHLSKLNNLCLAYCIKARALEKAPRGYSNDLPSFCQNKFVLREKKEEKKKKTKPIARSTRKKCVRGRHRRALREPIANRGHPSSITYHRINRERRTTSRLLCTAADRRMATFFLFTFLVEGGSRSVQRVTDFIRMQIRARTGTRTIRSGTMAARGTGLCRLRCAGNSSAGKSHRERVSRNGNTCFGGDGARARGQEKLYPLHSSTVYPHPSTRSSRLVSRPR